MRLAVVYDNRSLHRELSPAWGFSCLVGDDILFDTGGDGPRLLANMAQMELDVGRIKSLVLSHAHGDHTSGLGAILAINKDVTVYLPISFPASFKAQVRVRARVMEVRGPMEIAEGVYTTGEMGSGIREQALAVRTAQGLVVVTGCAHPGIVGMVRRARQIAGDDVYLVMGGIHLGGLRGKELRDIIAEFRRLGVRKVAPCHCTGKRARQMFAAEYGEDFIRAGVGLVLDIGP